MYRVNVLAGIVMSALTAAQALAQNSTSRHNRLEEVVVTSSRVAMPLRQVGTSVAIVTQEEIEQRGSIALIDILRSQPGIGVSSQGGPGSVTSLRIRGEESFRTRVFVDGIDISDTSSPQTSPRVEQLLSAGIQRVEVLRGPQGLMYGADAGGVVNITTIAPAEGLNGQASAQLGRYGAAQYAGNVNGGTGAVDFSVAATDYAVDGFNARTTDTTLKDDDGYDNTTLHGRLGWNVSDRLRLSLTVRDLDARHEYDGCFNGAFEESNRCEDDFRQRAWRTGADAQTGRFSHELFYSDSEIKRDFYADGQFSFKLDGGLERAGYLGAFTVSDALRLVYGVDLQTESVDDGFLDSERDQRGYYAEYQGGFAQRMFITAGARYDDNDDFGSHTSYRTSAAYLLPVAGGELKLRATWGTGFRAPSLNEIAINASEFTLPPAYGFDLSEEESEGYDLGVSWASDAGVYVEAVYFDQNISDEIFYDFNAFGYLQASGDTQSTGVELSAEWPLPNELLLTGNYTYTDSRDMDGEPRPRRPEHMSDLGILWQAWRDRLTLGMNARLSRDAIDIDGARLDDYEVLDLNARFVLGGGAEIFGRIENVTDEDYEEVPTYNTSGAAGYVGFRYSF